MSWILIGDVLSIVNFSPLCHGHSLKCLDNCLCVSIMSWYLIEGVLTIVHLSPFCHGYSLGVSSLSSICLHYVTGTHWECLDHCLMVSIMSWDLIGVFLQLFICLHYVMGTH